MRLQDLQSQFESKFKDFKTGFGSSSLINYNGKYLFVIDNEKHWQLGDENLITFGCVGGSVEDGENYEQALIREAREEIDSEIQIINSHKTIYLDLDGKITKLTLEDPVKPKILYENKFCSHRLGITYYLIALFYVNIADKPKPTSEIPAIFTADLSGYLKFSVPYDLERFRTDFEVIINRPIPSKGQITPFLTPKMLLTHFQNQIHELFPLDK